MTYTFYWGDVPNNFGDILTKNILDHFDIKHTHTNNFKNANMFATGSIARLASFGATVIGSGMIRKGENANPTVNWKSVRGPLTRDNIIRCGGECPKIYGDPALLLPMFCEESEKKHEIGLVPHYQDYDRVNKQYKDKYHVINVVNKDPLAVAKEITKCKKIISSSLHGIICAHAYQIPAAQIKFSKLHGDGTKFHDYYASVGLEPEESIISKPKFRVGKLPNLEPLKEIFTELCDQKQSS